MKGGLPGVSACVASKDRILWRGTAGHANVLNGVRIEDGDTFGVGSITKMFVTVVIFQLIEEGRLALSDTLGDLLPEEVLKDIPNASSASIATLLTHTSGIICWEDDPQWIKDARGINFDPSRDWGKTDCLNYIRHGRSLHPGRFSYANTNFTFVGLVVEKITKNTAESEIRSRILEPLGLTATYLEGFEPASPNRRPSRYHSVDATYVENAGGISPYFPQVRPQLIDVSILDLSVEWTAGGIVSSPSDLARFAVALRDGKLVPKGSDS